MPIGSIYRVNFNFIVFGQKCMMTWHMRNMNGAAGSGPQALSQLLLDVPAAQFRAIMSSSSSLTTIEVIEITGSNPPAYTRAVAPINAGGVAGAALLSETAVIWLLRTATAGRKGTGRMYFGAVPANTILDGYLTSSGFSGHNVRRANCLAVFGASGSNATYKWVVYSKKLGGLNPPIGTTAWNVITGVDVDKKIASRRTRKIGVGN
jgi:hypothetical protein